MKKLILIVATVFLVFVVGSMIAFVIFPPVFVELHNNSRRIPTDFDYGNWTGSTYKNDFFGFSITVPEDWYILGQEETEAFQKVGKEALQNTGISNEDEMRRVDKITEITTADLFNVMRYSMEEAVEKGEPNLNITLMVEKLPGEVGPRQYAKILCQNRIRQVPSLVAKPETNKVISGQEFVSQETELEVYGILVYQEHLICLKNGFVMVFILTWLNDSDKEQLDAIMATLTWE